MELYQYLIRSSTEYHEGLFSVVVAEVALGSVTLFSFWMLCLSGWAFCTLYLVPEPSARSSFSASPPLPGLWGPGLVQCRVVSSPTAVEPAVSLTLSSAGIGVQAWAEQCLQGSMQYFLVLSRLHCISRWQVDQFVEFFHLVFPIPGWWFWLD